eukprot:2953765-Prorocentrum_lima.AAC.1
MRKPNLAPVAAAGRRDQLCEHRPQQPLERCCQNANGFVSEGLQLNREIPRPTSHHNLHDVHLHLR